jgi:tetratricopeptide (TPR) repeat protein
MMTSDEYENRAWELYSNEKCLAAAELLQEAIGIYTNNLDLREHLVIALVYGGEFAEAVRQARDYQSIGGNAVAVRVFQAIALIKLGRKLAALAVLRSLEDEEFLRLGDGIRAMLNLTTIAGDESLRDQVAELGLKLARRLAAQYPDEVEPEFAIGFFMETGGASPELCLPYVREAVRRAPERHDFRGMLAYLLLNLHREDEALAELEKIPIDEIDSENLKKMANLYLERDLHEKAEVCLARLVEIEEKASDEKFNFEESPSSDVQS